MTKTKHGWDKFRPYQTGDLRRVWSDIRADDYRELLDLGLPTMKTLEEMLINMGARMQTWDTDEGPVSVFGVNPTENPKAGMLWSITANAAMPRWRFLVRHQEECFEWLARDHDVLFNFKDHRNTQQIKWLKKSGFKFIAKHAGTEGQTYYEFLRIMK